MTRAFFLRRLLAGTAGLGAAVAATLTFTGPVHAATSTQVYVDGVAHCLDPVTGDWQVEWTVSSWQSTVRFPDAYRLLGVETAPEGLAPDLPLGEYRNMDSTFTAEQTLTAGTSSVTLTVQAEWNNRITRTTTSLPVDRPEGCEGDGETDPGDPGNGDDPGEPGEPGEPAAMVDGVSHCDSLSVTVVNQDSTDSLEVAFVTSGTAEVVTIESGQSATVTFDASDGTIVTVTIGEVDHHIRWEDPGDCDAADAGRGAEDDGKLPVTGGSTALIAVGALALLALGGGLYLLARRRRVRFTA